MSYSIGNYTLGTTASTTPVPVTASLTTTAIGSIVCVFTSYCGGSVTSVVGGGVTDWFEAYSSSGPFGTSLWYGTTTSVGTFDITVSSIAATNDAGWVGAWASFWAQEILASGPDSLTLWVGGMWGFGGAVIAGSGFGTTPVVNAFNSAVVGLPHCWFYSFDAGCPIATWSCSSWICAVGAAGFTMTSAGWRLIGRGATQYASGEWTGVNSGYVPNVCNSNSIVMVI